MSTPGINNQLSSAIEQAMQQAQNVQAEPSADATSKFKGLLMESLNHVNDMQQQADKNVETLMTGGEINPAEVLASVQKADMTFRLMSQIRNKLVQAYQEVKEIRI